MKCLNYILVKHGNAIKNRGKNMNLAEMICRKCGSAVKMNKSDVVQSCKDN